MVSGLECEIQKSELNGVPLVTIKGMIKDQDVYRFSREMRSLSRQDYPAVVVDVTGLEFMDSHALGLLAYFHNALAKQGRSLVLLNENRDELSYINGLLESTGLKTVLKVVESKVAIFQ
ncbi:MAG: STAS domain-containing protein [Chitinivibrionales bacterium]|nr:STAS domain-containing protein [Chitinivibrionales bacterium]